MIVLIQNCHSLEFFAEPGRWVREPDHALAFPSSAAAMARMAELDLHPAQIVLKFDDRRYDIPLAKTADC
ncbi:MAG: hypothetical protein JWQ04_2323 [Pedosphaera sp.]|nr:hypothetical protein [Pedosphaera sp.]